jgi:hypothetical protein
LVIFFEKGALRLLSGVRQSQRPETDKAPHFRMALLRPADALST